MGVVDRQGVELLDRDQCLRLLARGYTGRVGLVVDGEPRVLPVNYVMDGQRVVFRTGDGLKLDAARRGDVVTFEVDAVNEDWHAGWSVLAVGRAGEVTDPQEQARLQRLPLRPWAPGRREHWVVVDLSDVSGRTFP
ncbi:MAG TPA: pyridoxamine 5'-phosphate oxidase family protein [Nitriliruptorales bacterium]|nr:pyridoxamine 5'-phosphate oxidase family protein [Nitriliruptorales bacterium]